MVPEYLHFYDRGDVQSSSQEWNGIVEFNVPLDTVSNNIPKPIFLQARIRQMPFLPSNQQRQINEGKCCDAHVWAKDKWKLMHGNAGMLILQQWCTNFFGQRPQTKLKGSVKEPNISIYFFFSAHHSMVIYCRCSVYW